MGGIRRFRYVRDRRRGFKSCPRVGGIGDPAGFLDPFSGFKSCPRVGGIVFVKLGKPDNRIVSSRAPVWGASIGKGGYTKCQKSFKSCPRVGGIYKVKFAIPDEN